MDSDSAALGTRICISSKLPASSFWDLEQKEVPKFPKMAQGARAESGFKLRSPDPRSNALMLYRVVSYIVVVSMLILNLVVKSEKRGA